MHTIDKCRLDEFLTQLQPSHKHLLRHLLGRNWRDSLLTRLRWLSRDRTFPEVWHLVIEPPHAKGTSGVIYLDTATWEMRLCDSVEEAVGYYVDGLHHFENWVLDPETPIENTDLI